ncbi:MAG TPA: hypothetical protein VFA71_12840 [Terriglobales bacterium]|nr:hypothetical protein [Terriglobales bacterium]
MSEYPDILEDYLEISRKRRNNRIAIAKTQLHLLDELSFQERVLKHYRNLSEELTSSHETTEDASHETFREESNFVESQIFFYQLYANAVRGIGDGIAWRVLNYDRAVLRALSDGQSKQQIVAQGTINELTEWCHQFDTDSGIAILNSLTNWLSIGDVTVLKNDNSVEIIEVKSSKTSSSRITRQKQRMRETVNFLNLDKGVFRGKTIEIIRLPIKPENQLSDLLSLLEIADKQGCAGARINNWCCLRMF